MKILVVGSSNVDINVLTHKIPKIGETLMANSMRYSYGGKGANQALTCAKLEADVTLQVVLVMMIMEKRFKKILEVLVLIVTGWQYLRMNLPVLH